LRIHVSIDSGIERIHAQSRLQRNLEPSETSFTKTGEFIRRCVDQGHQVRVLTCIGPHNQNQLFQLGEYLVELGVKDWNISSIIRAGRAQANYHARWRLDDPKMVEEQLEDLRAAFRWMRISFSNRVDQDGYYLLVLPDGTLATQYTDGQDKVVLGKVHNIHLDDIQNWKAFDLPMHGRKWISAVVGQQGLSDAYFYGACG